jgi:hypothetical protein
MLVTFPRLTDHARGYALIERDDGVRYRMWGAPVSHRLPHDLVHFTVEDALGMSDGIWAAVAGGIVFRSMSHVSGRRPPHAGERSDRMKAVHGARLRRAELIGGLVERLAEMTEAGAPTARRFASAYLSGLAEAPVDPERLLVAAARVRAAEAHWRALPVGGEVAVTWPAHRRLAVDRRPHVEHRAVRRRA